MNNTPEAPRRMTRVQTRSAQLREAHRLAHALGLETRPTKDRTEYNAILRCFCSEPSLRRASRAEREAVIAFFESCLADRDARKLHVPTYVSEAEFNEVLGL